MTFGDTIPISLLTAFPGFNTRHIFATLPQITPCTLLQRLGARG
jgi:hypothetical protein